MAYTRCLSLPVLSALLLVAFVYYTVLALTIRPWLGLLTAHGLAHALAFSLWLALVLWAYGLAVFPDPGPVPAKYSPGLVERDLEAEAQGEGKGGRAHSEGWGGAAVLEVKRKGAGEPRFCQKCRSFKPPRAHHCRVCKRCVLRMDHHCIWINNCVGHRNYKPFVLFVLYDVIALFHGLVLVLSHALSCLHPHSSLSAAQCWRKGGTDSGSFSLLNPSPTVALFCRVLFCVISLPLGVSLLVLLLWHVYLIALNKTTIEHMEGIRARLVSKSVEIHAAHPYDLGVLDNLSLILGQDPLFWFCPSSLGHLDSGLSFPTVYDALRP